MLCNDDVGQRNQKGSKGTNLKENEDGDKQKTAQKIKRMYIQHSFHIPLADDQGVGFPVPRAEVFHLHQFTCLDFLLLE